MKKLPFFSTMLIFCLTIGACDEDFFESTVEVDIPPHTPTLAVTAVFSSQDSTHEVFVSNSRSILDKQNYRTLADAVVVLKEGENVLETFRFDPLEGSFVAGFHFQDKLEKGKNYRLEVTHPDFEPVFSDAVLEPVVPITSATYEPEGTIDEEGYEADEIIVEFTDPLEKDNYYMFKAFIRGSYWNGLDSIVQMYELDLRSRDPLVTLGFNPNNYAGSPMLTDASFPGKKYELRLFVYPQFLGDSQEIVVQMYQISRERYLFLSTMKAFYETQDNPFAEPVTVSGNIVGGQGVFALQNMSQIRIKN